MVWLINLLAQQKSSYSKLKIIMQSLIDGRNMASELHILTGYFVI